MGPDGAVELTVAEREAFDELTRDLPRCLGTRVVARVLDGLAHLGGLGPSVAAARTLGGFA